MPPDATIPPIVTDTNHGTWLEPDAILRSVVEYAVSGIGLLAVVIALWGVGVGLAQLVRVERARLAGRDHGAESARLRHVLGFYMLLTLSFLVASDILETLVLPTLQHLAVLGGVMALRVVAGFTLAHELRE